MSYHPINIESLARIKNNIEQYSPYPKKVQIIAVTKKFSHHAIISAIKSSITCIGENQIQEFDKKQPHLLGYQFESHLIGHLQSNKIIKAIKLFKVIQTIDSFRLAQALNEKLKAINKKQNIYIQLNVGEDPHKYGFQTEDLLKQIEKIVKFKNIQLHGIMTILPFLEQAQETQKLYKKMRQIQSKIKEEIAPSCSCLSMGMSRDYIYALKEGATHIRLGTSLYGPRP